MRNYLFFHIWDNHFKMWSFDSKGEELTLYWGKIKSNFNQLQQKQKTFNNTDELNNFINNKIKSKLAKGYIRVEKEIYSQYSRREITLSQLVGKIESKKRAIDIVSFALQNQ